MVIEHHQLQEVVLILIHHQSLQDLTIMQSIIDLTLMLHHLLHQDILDMMDQEDIMVGKQKKVVLARPFG